MFGLSLLSGIFSNISWASIWEGAKKILVAIAVVFILYQAKSISNLHEQVTGLEHKQVELQQTITDVQSKYDYLNSVYQNSANTTQTFIDQLSSLSDKSTDLEKAFGQLERNAAAKALLGIQPLKKDLTNTTPGGSNEKAATGSGEASQPSNFDDGIGDDAAWRQLLDKTFCEAFPGDTQCSGINPSP